MTRSSKAMVLTGPREFTAQQFELPEITDNTGLLRVEACGLCGTDHELYTGHLPAPGPVVPGHETIGVIEDCLLYTSPSPRDPE